VGEDVRLLAAHGVSVTGLDIAQSAVSRARGFSKVSDEAYRLGDICDLPLDLEGGFDWVFEHTCYCALHPSQLEGYVEGVYRALRSGGILLGLFYPKTGNPPGEGPPYPTSPEELDRNFSRGFSLLKRWIPAVGYPGRVHNEEFRILMKTG
jgi:SAM-dependent methyltransferase